VEEEEEGSGAPGEAALATRFSNSRFIIIFLCGRLELPRRACHFTGNAKPQQTMRPVGQGAGAEGGAIRHPAGQGSFVVRGRRISGNNAPALARRDEDEREADERAETSGGPANRKFKFREARARARVHT
jgi:hypothetical protein